MLLCMRTTIEIGDELFRQAKRRAADDHVTLREIVEKALRGYLGPRPRRKKYKLRWGPGQKGRLMPGVDLDDRDSLYEIMEGRR